MAGSEFQIRSELSEVVNELTDSDLVFEVTAKPGGSVSRDRRAIQPVQDAIEATLLAFRASVATQVERVAVLEEVSKSCLTLWFRFHACAPSGDGDAAPRAPDPALLKFVGQGLLTILSWLDGRSPLRLSNLQQALKVLAWGTFATSSSRPPLPASLDLVNAVAAWGRVKNLLGESASARLVLQQGSIDLDLAKSVPDISSLVDKKLVNRTVEMIVVVEQPDYAAAGEWLLKHGQAHFTARCGPCDVLDRFYRRELDIRPGDALHCKVEFDTSYGPDHEVVDERLSVVDVIEVLSASGPASEAAGPSRAKAQKAKVAEVPDRMLVL